MEVPEVPAEVEQALQLGVQEPGAPGERERAARAPVRGARVAVMR